jgi:hypothetical protein
MYIEQGIGSLEKAPNSNYEANTPKICHVKKFIARWSEGSQSGQWWEIEGLATAIWAAIKNPLINRTTPIVR